jgi:DNA-binding Xre family transcriptional regulator
MQGGTFYKCANPNGFGTLQLLIRIKYQSMATSIAKKDSVATEYHSPLLDNLLANIDPATLAKTEARMLIACKIADALAEKKMSKKDFVQQLGKQPSTITKWLSGKHDFTHDTLTKIAGVLNIDFFEQKIPVQTVKKYRASPSLNPVYA